MQYKRCEIFFSVRIDKLCSHIGRTPIQLDFVERDDLSLKDIISSLSLMENNKSVSD